MKMEDKLTLIKGLRKEKNISQEELASGICSVPYLSKMENLKVMPSEEVIDLLMDRLDVEGTYLQSEEVMEKVWKLYNLIEHQEIKEAKTLFKHLQDIMHNYLVDPSVSLYFKLFSIKYYLTLKDLNKARVFMDLSLQLEEMFDKDMLFYFKKFQGQYYYMNNEFDFSLHYFREAESALNETQLPEEEKYSLYYNLGLVLSRLFQLPESIFYTRESLNYYNQVYNFPSIIKCCILQSINFRKTGNPDTAKTYLQKAEKIAQSMNDHTSLGKIYHNMGFLQATEDNPKAAIELYKKSLEYKELDDISKCQTYHAIVKEYMHRNENEKAYHWCQKGLAFAQSTQRQSHIFHFTLLANTLGDNHPDLEAYLKDEVIPFFQKKNSFEDIVKYTEMLANYYEEKFYYKKANKLYKDTILQFKNKNFLT